MREQLRIHHIPSLKQIAGNISAGKNTVMTGVTVSMAAFSAARLAEETGKRIMLVLPNDLQASHCAADTIPFWSGTADFLPGGEIDLIRGASGHENAWRRIAALDRIRSGETKLLCTSADALCQRMGDPDLFRRITLSVGSRFDPEKLVKELTHSGYERVSMVEGKGQCALRGSILDVYSPAAANGVRIEFFDDEVDSIRSFDCITQRSLETLETAVLSPASEVLLRREDFPAAAERMRNALRTAAPRGVFSQLDLALPPLPDDEEDEEEADSGKDKKKKLADKPLSAEKQDEMERRISYLMGEADLLEAGMPFHRIAAWLPVVTEGTYTLTDWYRPDAILFMQPDQISDRCRSKKSLFAEDLQAAMERGEAVKQQEELLMDWETILLSCAKTPLVALSEMLLGQGGISADSVLNPDGQGVTGYQNQMKNLASDIRSWMGKGWSVLLLSGGVARGEHLTTALAEFDLHAAGESAANGPLTILPATLSHGFIWPEAKLAVVADTDIFGAGYRKAKGRRHTGEKIAAFTDLKVGDYVVHEDHGVGIYQGTTRIQTEGAWRDYLLIQYHGADKLYVPIDQLERVQRYIGNPNQEPKLNSLGGSEWQRQKGRVKEGLKKLAFDLVQLYARRTQENGYAFGKAEPWQGQFDDRFPYELTEDQAQSVKDIFADMESHRNMDRLLCGDVGYGKTEVSLRAAFKAAIDGKQVAILAPTTILAQQHYHTVINRFREFPVRIEMLSRFRSPKEQKEIIARVRTGEIDIIIGTHRLLAKDVSYKDLGLLIVDEEQRFGVGHKEIIKNMKEKVDVLTLSATPIPRTLNMSLTGIRDLSLLETPPEERLPVQTHVVEYSDSIVREAIIREMNRGGQVYFLYNRVQSIDRFYQRLRALVPEARIGVAHGQMRENALEDVMMDFYNGSFDVLLCTTIIENGLDVPTANTIFIYDADRFGLSQLYQLRGRVGRSNRQAYAYFTVRPDKLLSETAQQRLSAIREFTEFGAGFRIAMRDLEIRGAGNLLGPEQHGHLATVGYDMYLKLMEQTLNEVKGVPQQHDLSTRVDLNITAFLPTDYISDEKQRLEMYKRIAAMSSEQDRADIVDELMDRFGEMPAETENLLDISQLRYLAAKLGASQVLLRKEKLTLKLDEQFLPDTDILLGSLGGLEISLLPVRPPAMEIPALRLNPEHAAQKGIRVLLKLTDRMDKLRAERAEKEQAAAGC